MTPTPPAQGDPAPPFTLPDADSRPVSLTDFAGRRVIVYFYPKAMTPGCTRQACDFTAAHEQLARAGYHVIGISPDVPERLARFRDAESLELTLLSDPDKTVMTAYGAFGEKKSYGRTAQGVIRSTFVIDGDGRIDQVWRNVKATGHVGRVLTALGIG